METAISCGKFGAKDGGDGLEYVPCPACGCEDSRILFTKRDLTHSVSAIEFPIVQCRDCQFVYLNPRPNEHEIHKYYPPEFYAVDSSPEEILQDKRSTLDARLRMLSHLRPGRLLDIGCSRGEFLHRMREFGWDPFGIDFSSTAPNMFNVPMFIGNVHDAPYPQESFDLVTLWAVLEHTRDPLDMLQQVRSFLKPTGKAVILVPNFNSIPGRFMRHDDVPRHLVMFTPKSLRALAQCAGLKVNKLTFSDDIFSGSTRGVLNYAWKLLHGEKIEEIVAQNREPNRWHEFAQTIHGKDNRLMLKVDRLDIRLTKYLDKLVNYMGYGFTMTAELEIA